MDIVVLQAKNESRISMVGKECPFVKKIKRGDKAVLRVTEARI